MAQTMFDHFDQLTAEGMAEESAVRTVAAAYGDTSPEGIEDFRVKLTVGRSEPAAAAQPAVRHGSIHAQRLAGTCSTIARQQAQADR